MKNLAIGNFNEINYNSFNIKSDDEFGEEDEKIVN